MSRSSSFTSGSGDNCWCSGCNTWLVVHGHSLSKSSKGVWKNKNKKVKQGVASSAGFHLPTTRRSWPHTCTTRLHGVSGARAATSTFWTCIPRGGGVPRPPPRLVNATARRNTVSSSPSVTSAWWSSRGSNSRAMSRRRRTSTPRRGRRWGRTGAAVGSSSRRRSTSLVHPRSTTRTRGGTIFIPRQPPTTTSIFFRFNFRLF
jgi:hypothetical protein